MLHRVPIAVPVGDHAGRPAAIASIGVRPNVSWMLSDSEVKMSAACQIGKRTSGVRASTKCAVTLGQKCCAVAERVLDGVVGEPAGLDQMQALARRCAARSSARYIGKGCALAW